MPVWRHLKSEQVGKGQEKKKINIVVLFRSYPTCNRKFKKNSKKIQRLKKYHYGFILSQNRLEKDEKEKKKLSVRSIPSRRITENSKKIAKKFKKN